MTIKRHVTFRLSDVGPTPAVDWPNLAVEVHGTDSTLAGRGTLDGGVELEPGQEYYVSATLPDGSRVSTQTRVDPTTTEIVLRQPAAAWADPSAIQRATADAPSSKKTASAPWRVTGFRGNLLKGKPTFFSPRPTELTAASAVSTGTIAAEVLAAWSVEFDHGKPSYIQLVQRDLPVWNYAVPLDEQAGCTIRLIRTVSQFAIDIIFPNSNVDLLLRYVGNNLLQEVSQTAESRTILAQDLVRGKCESPIGATVGAYALLRLGELDRLHDKTKNLYRRFFWLPDGIVILAEHLARVGDHGQALAVLLELPQRGLPFFTSGLTFAVNRLRQYRRAVEKGTLAGDITMLNSISMALERYAGLVDVTNPILSFMGADPLKPTHRPGSLSTR